MNIKLEVTFEDEGVPYDPDTVELSDSSGENGIVDALGAEVVAVNTALTRISDGVYVYIVDVTPEQLPLAAYVKVQNDEDVAYLEKTLTYANYLGRYTSVLRLRNKFGNEAIDTYSRLSGNETDEQVEERLATIIYDVEAEIDDYLRGGAYAVPFTSPIPAIIIRAATELAGCDLYEARGIEGYDPDTGQFNNKFAFMRKRAKQMLLLVKNGKVSLNAEAKELAPKVVEDECSSTSS